MKKLRPCIASTLALLVLSCFFSNYCLADEGQPDVKAPTAETNYPDAWHLSLAPYIWYSGVTGYYLIKDSRANLFVPFDQIRHRLDFGAAAIFEAQRYCWTLMLDTSYVKFTQPVYSRGTSAKASQGTTIIDGGAYYLLLSQAASQDAYTRASLELLGGARIMAFHSTINYYNNTKTASDTSSFIVPLIGARVKYNFNKKTHSWLSADIGGFKMDHVNNTWSAVIGVGCSLTKHSDLDLAYKALGVNYYQHGITINTLLRGPMLGLTYSW